jgi:hypothetical protein
MVCVSEVEPVLESIPPAGIDVTVYPVITEPPLLTGAAKLTVVLALPAVATTEVGALGTEAEVTSLIRTTD